MIDRPTRIKNFILSPAMSILVSLTAFPELLFQGLQVWLFSVLVGALMVYNVKARTLFRGPNFPIFALFLILQALSAPVAESATLIALFVALALTALYPCYGRPDLTRLYYLIFLVCGLGSLRMRAFLLAGAALLIVMLLLRALSMRGFVAALLGLLTPLIILAGFGQLDFLDLIEMYMLTFELGVNVDWIFPASVALLFGLIMFLPSYGYPAVARSRNMAMLGLTACSIALPCVDYINMSDYLPLLNLCAAYNVSHFAATRRFGWIGAILVVLAGVAYVIMLK